MKVILSAPRSNRVEVISMPLRLDKQTAQDYSVVVEDPDPDASDPDEWREFFSQFGEVASISIALDNGHLISLLADCRVSKIARAISEHRQFKSVEVVNKVQTTEEQTPEGQTVNQRWMENEVNRTTKSLVKVSTLFGGDPERRDAMLSQLVEDAVQRKYPVARVFCIFEHEAGQRCCLDKLSNGIVAAVFDIGDLKPEHKFRGQNVLKVVEAPEPTDVIWERLNRRTNIQTLRYLVASNSFVFFCFGLSVVLIGRVSSMESQYSHIYVACTVSGLTSFVPIVIEAAVDGETHTNRSGVERAILVKTFIFDVLTSTFAIWMFTPFEQTLDPVYLDQVQQVLVFDSMIGPLVQWLQPWVYFKRRWLAPIVKNPNLQGSYFGGRQICVGSELGHRLSTMQLGFFAVAILPLGLGVTCLAFLIAYWTSKHGLFRRWLRLPNYGTSLMTMCCLFTYLSILVSMVMTGQFYAGWPFDKVCFDDGDRANEPYMCNRRPGAFFFTNAQRWMSPDQRLLVLTCKWCTLVFAVVLFLWWVTAGAVWSTKALFVGYTDGVGQAQGNPYTTVDEIQAYIPFIGHSLLETPLLCCDQTLFDNEYVHFQGDPTLFDIYADADLITSTDLSKVDMSHLFSVCKFYPTIDNPDPTRKIDDGDHQLGKLWIIIEKVVGAKRGGLSGARHMGVKLKYRKGIFHTDNRKADDAEYNEEFLVLITDLDKSLELSVRDYSLAKMRKLGITSLDMKSMVDGFPKAGGSVSRALPLIKQASSIPCTLTPLAKDATLRVKYTWEPNEIYVKMQAKCKVRILTANQLHSIVLKERSHDRVEFTMETAGTPSYLGGQAGGSQGAVVDRSVAEADTPLVSGEIFNRASGAAPSELTRALPAPTIPNAAYAEAGTQQMSVATESRVARHPSPQWEEKEPEVRDVGTQWEDQGGKKEEPPVLIGMQDPRFAHFTGTNPLVGGHPPSRQSLSSVVRPPVQRPTSEPARAASAGGILDVVQFANPAPSTSSGKVNSQGPVRFLC
jgi:hypothetical protein